VGYIHKSIGEAMMQRPQPERTSSGIPQSLQAALEDTGRTRGSAATPIISPAPNRAFQSQIDSLNNASINQRNFSNMSSGPGPFVSTWNLNQGLHNRNASSSTQRSGVSGSGQNQNQGHAKQPHNRQNSSSSHQSSSSYQSPARSRPTPAQMIPVGYIHLYTFRQFTNNLSSKSPLARFL
jgi:hypothetical protein